MGSLYDNSKAAVLRPVTLGRLLPNILQDQKRIWFFPVELLRGKHWRPTLGFLVATTGLVLLVDPYDPSYFRHAAAFHAFNRIVSGHHAALFMYAVMITALVLGVVWRDSYLRGTFFCALEAVADVEILTQVLKGIDHRLRPQDVHNYRCWTDTWFRDKGPWYAGAGSFPSGHMIAAISIATVFAVRYRDHRWMPWAAYGLAGMIGFSRITLLSHFPSDVFAGAVLGYVITRYVVLRRPASAAEAR